MDKVTAWECAGPEASRLCLPAIIAGIPSTTLSVLLDGLIESVTLLRKSDCDKELQAATAELSVMLWNYRHCNGGDCNSTPTLPTFYPARNWLRLIPMALENLAARDSGVMLFVASWETMVVSVLASSKVSHDTFDTFGRYKKLRELRQWILKEDFLGLGVVEIEHGPVRRRSPGAKRRRGAVRDLEARNPWLSVSEQCLKFFESTWQGSWTSGPASSQ